MWKDNETISSGDISKESQESPENPKELTPEELTIAQQKLKWRLHKIIDAAHEIEEKRWKRKDIRK